MKKVTVSPKEAEAYHEEAKEWSIDIHDRSLSRQRAFLIMSLLSLATAAVSVFAVASMAPLKEAVPYVIEVDRTTGISQVKRPLSEGPVTATEAMAKFDVVRYINAREGYIYDTITRDYNTVSKMSNQPLRQAYFKAVTTTNQDAPINVYGEHTQVNIQVRNISFIDDDTVTVPIIRTLIKGITEKVVYDVVTLSFEYTNIPLSEEDRLINPNAFQVKMYRVDTQVAGDIIDDK